MTANTDLVPLVEAAKAIGCRPLALARAVKRAGLYDPIGAKLGHRDWVVYRYETEGARLVMNRRKLVPSVGTSPGPGTSHAG
jgi:hypothetical protein